MSTERERVLGRIRDALGRDRPASAAVVAEDREARLAGPLPRPAWQEGRLARFTARLERAAATWEWLEDVAALPRAVAPALQGAAPKRLRLAGHPLLRGLDWPGDWETAEGPAGAADWPVALTVAAAGIAETGTLVFRSGADSPTTLNFLPDRHLVLLRAADVGDYPEEVWPRLRAEGAPPRAVNLVTGPSRTADVEQTLQLGAHGPRQLHVLLLVSEC